MDEVENYRIPSSYENTNTGDTTSIVVVDATKVINSSPFHSTPFVDLYLVMFSLATHFRLVSQ